jgi:hypothetical protein
MTQRITMAESLVAREEWDFLAGGRFAGGFSPR